MKAYFNRIYSPFYAFLITLATTYNTYIYAYGRTIGIAVDAPTSIIMYEVANALTRPHVASYRVIDVPQWSRAHVSRVTRTVSLHIDAEKARLQFGKKYQGEFTVERASYTPPSFTPDGCFNERLSSSLLTLAKRRRRNIEFEADGRYGIIYRRGLPVRVAPCNVVSSIPADAVDLAYELPPTLRIFTVFTPDALVGRLRHATLALVPKESREPKRHDIVGFEVSVPTGHLLSAVSDSLHAILNDDSITFVGDDYILRVAADVDPDIAGKYVRRIMRMDLSRYYDNNERTLHIIDNVALEGYGVRSTATPVAPRVPRGGTPIAFERAVNVLFNPSEMTEKMRQHLLYWAYQRYPMRVEKTEGFVVFRSEPLTLAVSV